MGYNYRLSELASALGRVQLSRIDEILSQRHAAAERYQELLSGVPEIEPPPFALPRRIISWFVYVVRLRADSIAPDQIGFRDRVQAALGAEGIASGNYFAPIHQLPAWRKHPSAATRLPHTESIARRTLAVPFFNRITADQQQEVIETLIRAVREL